MRKLPEKAVAAISVLTEEQQDEAALVLLPIAGIEPPLELDEEDRRELALSLAQEEAGDFATESEIKAIWAKHGR